MKILIRIISLPSFWLLHILNIGSVRQRLEAEGQGRQRPQWLRTEASGAPDFGESEGPASLLTFRLGTLEEGDTAKAFQCYGVSLVLTLCRSFRSNFSECISCVGHRAGHATGLSSIIRNSVRNKGHSPHFMEKATEAQEIKKLRTRP